MRYRIFVVFIMAIVILSSGFMLHQMKALNTLNNNWNLFTAAELKKATTLTSIERSLGYTGFIHHFKNYLLRRSDFYYDKAIESYKSAKNNLLLLEEISSTAEEKHNIVIVSNTIDEYYLNLQKAHDEWHSFSIAELDKKLKVDDFPAKSSLDNLRQLIEQRFDLKYQDNLLKTNSLSRNTFVSAFIIIPLMFFLSIAFYLLLKRYTKIYTENNIVLERSPDAILSADANGKIIQANHVARELFGYSANEFSHLTIEDLILKEFRNQHIENRKHFIKKEQHRQMSQRDTLIQGVKKSGELVDLNITIASTKIDGETRTITIARDITSINNLEKEATLDHLTSCLNRRAIDQHLNDEIERTKRYQRPLTLMLIDIDRFKNLNDQHGHLMGDEAIKTVSSFLKDMIRPSDKLGRWGGDEFLLICPELEELSSLEFAERIRTQFCQHPIAMQFDITLSIGIVTYLGEDDLIASQLVNKADSALYRSKKEGRNKVNIFI